MIIRLVSLKFNPEHREEFLQLFEQVYPRIRARPGCLALHLVADLEASADFLTISVWRSAEDLEAYRQSDIFGEVWPQVRQMLRERARAASYRLVAGDPYRELSSQP